MSVPDLQGDRLSPSQAPSQPAHPTGRTTPSRLSFPDTRQRAILGSLQPERNDAGSNPQLKRLEQKISAGISGHDSRRPCERVSSDCDPATVVCFSFFFFMSFGHLLGCRGPRGRARQQQMQKGLSAEQLWATELENKREETGPSQTGSDWILLGAKVEPGTEPGPNGSLSVKKRPPWWCAAELLLCSVRPLTRGKCQLKSLNYI